MFEGIYLVSHGGVVPGRERFIPELFKNSADFWRTQDGATSIGTYFLTPASGSRDHMAFMSLYRGNLGRLNEIVTSERYERLWAVTAQATKNLSGRLYGTGDRQMIDRIMGGAQEEWGKTGFPGA